MRAYQVRSLVHPRDIAVSDDVPVPIPKDGQVVVDVYAAGLNFFDILQAQGKYQTKPPLPFVLGAEFAGKIREDSPIPPKCSFKRGDRVFGFASGAYAEQVVAEPKNLIRMPDNVSMEEAAVVSLTYTTSYEGLVHRGQVKKGALLSLNTGGERLMLVYTGDWVLVHAGAGGVGLAACQIAKLLGAKVIATASTEEKRRICTEKAGVDVAIDYTQSGWQEQVMKATGGKGVDVVYDPVGLILPSLKCVAWNARIVVVGFAAGNIEKVPANLLLLKQVSLVGLYWGGGTMRDPKHAAEVIKAVYQLLSTGKLRPIIYQPIYEGLENVSKGLTDLDNRKIWGKGVVRIKREARREAKL